MISNQTLLICLANFVAICFLKTAGANKILTDFTEECQKQWKRSEQPCYLKFDVDQTWPYEKALQYCNLYQARLPVFHTFEEYDHFKRYADWVMKTNGKKKLGLWLGYAREVQNATFTYQSFPSKQSCAIDFKMYFMAVSTEPFTGKDVCILLSNLVTSELWEMEDDCSIYHPFICQRPKYLDDCAIGQTEPTTLATSTSPNVMAKPRDISKDKSGIYVAIAVAVLSLTLAALMSVFMCIFWKKTRKGRNIAGLSKTSKKPSTASENTEKDEHSSYLVWNKKRKIKSESQKPKKTFRNITFNKTKTEKLETNGPTTKDKTSEIYEVVK